MKRVFPAPAYDALKQMAEEFGGIGGGRMMDAGAPYCVLGFASRQYRTAGFVSPLSIYAAISATSIGVLDNDKAVRRINRRRSFWRSLIWGGEQRVPFTDWCAELGVERGA